MDYINPDDIPEGFGGGAIFGLRDLAVTATCVTYLALAAHLDPTAPPETAAELAKLAGDWGDVVRGPLMEAIANPGTPEEAREAMAESLSRTGNDFTAMAYDIKAKTGLDVVKDMKPPRSTKGAMKRMTERLHRSTTDSDRAKTHDLVREIADHIEGIDAS